MQPLMRALQWHLRPVCAKFRARLHSVGRPVTAAAAPDPRAPASSGPSVAESAFHQLPVKSDSQQSATFRRASLKPIWVQSTKSSSANCHRFWPARPWLRTAGQKKCSRRAELDRSWSDLVFNKSRQSTNYSYTYITRSCSRLVFHFMREF